MKKKLMKLLTLCLGGVMICCSFAGCGNTDAKNTTSSSTLSSTSSEESNELKTLTLATGAELTTLFPLNMDRQNLSATRLCYEQLVDYVDGEVKPWLATSWEYSNDGKDLTFKLRDDVTYHDGTKFNAETVKADFEFASKNQNFRCIKAVNNLKSVEVIDAYTVKFHYDTPYFAYLTDFCYREVMVCVSPKVIEKDNFQTMKGVVGTGPYLYEEIKDGEYVRFVRNENYWGEKPYYDEVIVKYIPESSARLLALQKGEIDMIYGNSLITWDDFEQGIKQKNIKGIVSPIDSKTCNVVLNASNPVLTDVKVREAIAYAIDKQNICDGLTYGNQNPANTLFTSGNKYTDVKFNTIRVFDKDKAKELLDESGYKLNQSTGIREKNGQPLSFKFTYDSGDVMNKMLTTTIKSQLAEVGIDVKTEGQDLMTWWKEGVAGNYGMTIWGTEENTAPQNFYMNMPDSSPHTPSMANLKNKDKFINSIAEMQMTNDEEKVKEIFTFLLNYDNDNVINVPIYYVKDMILFNTNKISGYTFTSTPLIFEIDNIKPAE